MKNKFLKDYHVEYINSMIHVFYFIRSVLWNRWTVTQLIYYSMRDRI